jgi:predicted PurR-regulated permease PerM
LWQPCCHFYQVIQFVRSKSNAVTPKILGDLIGLNPVWILLSLLIGSQLAGVLGLLLAVPLAGALKRIFEERLQEQ